MLSSGAQDRQAAASLDCSRGAKDRVYEGAEKLVFVSRVRGLVAI